MSLRRNKVVRRGNLEFEDIDDNFFGDAPTGLTEATKDTGSLTALVGLGILATGLVAGGLAAKNAIDAKKERERIQKEEIAKMKKQLEAIKKNAL